jgi:hypothetical protein
MPHQIVHLQVSGSQSREVLQEIGDAFSKALQDPDRGTNVITTPDNVRATVINVDEHALSNAVTVYATLLPLDIAAVAHEINRNYCAAIGDPVPLPWQEAGEAQHTGMLRGVIARLNKDMTPEQQHEMWCASKTANGWTYGETKDEEKKTHPNLRPYAELGDAQKVKDSLFAGTVNGLRPYLPKPSYDLKAVVVAGEQKNFLELAAGDTFRFADGDKHWVAVSGPYIAYTQNDAAYTIDVREPDQAADSPGTFDAGQDESGPGDEGSAGPDSSFPDGATY